VVDGLCVLALNIMNEKIYILLWFWFVSLAILSGLQLIWRLATLASARLRESILR
jgi:innexin